MPQSPVSQELWTADHPLGHAAGRLLRQLLTSRIIDQDQLARHCLTPFELAGLLDPNQQHDAATQAVEALMHFLEDNGRAASLGAAMRDWRVSMELLRSRFGWSQLPPAVQKRAHCRARELADMLIKRRWVMLDDRGHLMLTDRGRRVARRTLR